jgi:hypothetical protein
MYVFFMTIFLIKIHNDRKISKNTMIAYTISRPKILVNSCPFSEVFGDKHAPRGRIIEEGVGGNGKI